MVTEIGDDRPREDADKERDAETPEADAHDQLLSYARSETLTLLCAASDRERNNAVVLRDYLEERLADS